MLGLYIDSTLKLNQDRHKPLAKSFKSFLQALSAFKKKTRQGPSNHNILEEVRKAADASTHRETFIEEQIIAMKNSAITSNPSYANIASQGAAQKATTRISFPATPSPTPAFNKANKIIIKLDDKDSTQALNTQSSENIVRDINYYLHAKNISHTSIRAARKLKTEIL